MAQEAWSFIGRFGLGLGVNGLINFFFVIQSFLLFFHIKTQQLQIT